MSSPLHVIAHYRVSPGRTQDVLRLLAELTEASRAEAENLSYEAFRSVEDPDHLVLIERYTSADGFAAHRASEHFERIAVQGIIPLLQERTVTVLDVRP